MYDFETISFAIPRYLKTSPYEKLPVQFSIQVINSNQDLYAPQSIKEYSFLADKNQKISPENQFYQALVNVISNLNIIPIFVAYNASFEKTCLKKAIQRYPEFSKKLMLLFNNTIDLHD
jgi:hypothetical protein